MPIVLSNAAQHLLNYLGIYKLTPHIFANELSGAYPGDFSTKSWFTNSLNYGTQTGKMNPHGLFRDALNELLTNGY